MHEVFVTASLLAGITFIAVYLIIKTKTKKQKEPRYISLEELSSIWCKEQKQTTKQVPSKQIEQNQKEPEQKQQKEISFNHQAIKEFWKAYIAPNKNILSLYLSAIKEVLEILDRWGDCPSVVSGIEDKESRELSSTYEILSKISLLEHTLNVVYEMISICKKSRKDWDLILGKIVIAGLGHDIGKIPQLREQSTSYCTGDHAIISYKILKEILPINIERDEILKAVRDHHYHVTGELASLLKQADYTAREKEISKIDVKAALKFVADKREEETKDSDKSICELKGLEWLDLEEVLLRIEERINKEEDGVFRAFSMRDGLVYVMPVLISDIVFKLAEENGHKELLIYQDELNKRREIEYFVVQRLRERELVSSIISEGYIGARFEILIKEETGKEIYKKGFYLPLRAEAFKVSLNDLEQRKKNTKVISKILKVRPIYR